MDVKRMNTVDCWAPVTALHVLKDYLFSGSGNKIEIWSLKESQSQWKPITVKWLTGPSSIHGINASSTSDGIILAINANRFLTILNLVELPLSDDIDELKLEIIQDSINLGDWIMTARFKNDKIYVILASNSIITFDLKSKQLFPKVFAPVQCILYSALIISVDPEDNVLIGSGTVFKQTSIWSLTEGLTKVVNTLEGHDGAIFALEYDYQFRRLFSASDDRSIHVWHHEGCNLESAETWSSGKFSLCHRLFGHNARIWSLITLNGYLVSCGENDDICLWSADSGKLLCKSNREDASLWCLAASQSKEIIFIGSSDSSIRMFPLKDKLLNSNRYHYRYNSTYPKTINYINTKSSPIELICISNDGVCSKLAIVENELKVLSKIELGKDFETYCVTSVDQQQNLLLCASKTGLVKALHVPSMKEKYFFQAHGGKIFSCLTVNKNVLVTSGPEGKIKLWTKTVLICNHQLSSSKHRWVTCAIHVNDRLIAGDANGHIFVFNRDQVKAVQCLASVHSSNGVNDLKFRPSSDLVYSCGREGKVQEYIWDGLTLTKLRILPLKIDFDWIERIYFDYNNQLFLIGFSSTKFIVWQHSDQSVLWSIDCGGGHRLWSFIEIENLYNFCYCKQSELHVVSHSFTNFKKSGPFIKQELHSNRINCCRLVDFNEPNALIATGGEDNNILLSEFNVTTGTLTVKDYCKGHISSIRALSSIKRSDGSLLLVSGGGQSQLIVWLLKKRSDQLLISRVANHFLNHDDNVSKRKSWRDLKRTNDPKSRYLSININQWNNNQDVYTVTVACSDSYLKLFSLTNSNKITFIGEVQISNHCPLAIDRINETLITGSTDGFLRFWTIKDHAIKDNNLSLESQIDNLDISSHSLFIKTFENLTHQSGINCISSRQIHDDVWLVLSSGDDTILTATLISLNGNNVNLLAQKKFNYIHSSQISVVSFVDHSSFITCSIDQRLKLWNCALDLNNRDVTINIAACHVVSIADISSATILNYKNDNFVLVVGEGIQIFRIHSNGLTNY